MVGYSKGFMLPHSLNINFSHKHKPSRTKKSLLTAATVCKPHTLIREDYKDMAFF